MGGISEDPSQSPLGEGAAMQVMEGKKMAQQEVLGCPEVTVLKKNHFNVQAEICSYLVYKEVVTVRVQ